MNKVYPDAKSALEGILKDGMMIMSALGLLRHRRDLVRRAARSGVKNLTVVSTMPASTASD